MIKVTDVGGNEKYINCDLIEKIELIPDTLLVLVNGHSFIVRESPDELIERVVTFKNNCYNSAVTNQSILVDIKKEADGIDKEKVAAQVAEELA